MASAPVLPQVSVEEYIHTTYEPECEFVDGALEQKSMGTILHGRLQTLIIRALADAERQFGLMTLTEARQRIAPRRFRVPDVTVFSGEVEGERFATSAPLFTIEVVSPDEPWSRLMAKAADHLSAGAATVVIADPESKTVFTVRPEEGLHEIRSPKHVSVAVPGRGTLTLDFDELFAKL